MYKPGYTLSFGENLGKSARFRPRSPGKSRRIRLIPTFWSKATHAPLLSDLFEWVVAGEASPECYDPITAHAFNTSQREIGALPQAAPGRRHNPFGHGETSYSKSGAPSPGMDSSRPSSGMVSALWYLSVLSRED